VNPDEDGSWLNRTTEGTNLIRMIARHNRTAARDPTKLVWKEVAAIPWFGKNIGKFDRPDGDPTRRACGTGVGCHTHGFPINNHANWTQDRDGRDVPTMGGKQFMDKNYCEFVAAPAFAHDDKRITYDNQFFRGAMHEVMTRTPNRKWQTEAQCKQWWTNVGCVLDANKQKSVVEMCDKTLYPGLFR